MEDINLKDLEDLTLVELLESMKGLEKVLDEVEGEIQDGKNNG